MAWAAGAFLPPNRKEVEHPGQGWWAGGCDVGACPPPFWFLLFRKCENKAVSDVEEGRGIHVQRRAVTGLSLSKVNRGRGTQGLLRASLRT